jgi:hypothetical protein
MCCLPWLFVMCEIWTWVLKLHILLKPFQRKFFKHGQTQLT